MSWKLYEIDALLRDAIDAAELAVDEETGEIPADWAVFLDGVQVERDAKALGVAAYVRELQAEADAVEAEQERLKRRAKALNNKADRLKMYLSAFVDVGEKLKNSFVSIGWRASTVVDVWAPVESLPEKYVRTIPAKYEPDKRAIGDALKGGTEIEGCALINHNNIQIR